MIAEFLGDAITDSDGNHKEEQNYKYHISWNQLMPVGKKLRKLFEPIKTAEDFQILVGLTEAVSSFDLEIAYNEMVATIKWYNENK